MPNYVGNSNWNDAAEYGRGLGNSLSQAMLQMPLEKMRLAQQLAQMQQAQRYQQQSLGLEGQRVGIDRQRLQDMAQYHGDTLDLRRAALELTNAIQQQRNEVAQGQLQRQTDADRYRQSLPIIRDGFMVTPTQSNGATGATSPTDVPPWTVQSLPRVSNPSQALGAQAALEGRLSGDVLVGMNSTKQGINDFVRTNTLPRLLQLQRGGLDVGAVQAPQMQQAPQALPTQQPPQASRSFDTNSILQQAQQAIQMGADPTEVRQRMQQQFGITMP